MLFSLKNNAFSLADKSMLFGLNSLLLGVLAVSFLLGNFLESPVAQMTQWQTLCTFKQWTHLPCATCGMTRAFLLISQGNLGEAFRYNLLSVPFYGSMLFFLGASLTRPELALAFARFFLTQKGLFLLGGLLLLGWLYKLTSPPLYW